MPQVLRRRFRSEDLRSWLDTFRFDLKVTLGEGDVAISANPLYIFGSGPTFDAAIDDLVVNLQAYAEDFFQRSAFLLGNGPSKALPTCAPVCACGSK